MKTDEHEVVKADRETRRKALILLATAAAAGVLVISCLRPAFIDYLNSQDVFRKVFILKTTLAFLFLSVIPAGVYIYCLARKIVNEKRFPPTGMKVIKDVRLVTGRKAVLRGYVLIAAASALICLSLTGAGFSWFALNMLMGC